MWELGFILFFPFFLEQGKKVQRVMTIDSWMTCSCAVMGELLVYVFSQSLAMLG